MANRLTRGDSRTRSATHPVALLKSGRCHVLSPGGNLWSTRKTRRWPVRSNAWRGASRLACATSGWRRAAPRVVPRHPFRAVAPNTTCPRSLLCAPELGTNAGGGTDDEHIHHQLGNRAHARDHGAGPSHQAERAVRPHVQPGVRDRSPRQCSGSGVQGRIEDDFSGVVHVELPTQDIAGGHEFSSSWHLIARARHPYGLSCRVQEYPGHLPGGRWCCEVAKEDDVTPVIDHWAAGLAVHAPAGRRVARVRDGPDVACGGFLDVDAAETGDEESLAGGSPRHDTPRQRRGP